MSLHRFIVLAIFLCSSPALALDLNSFRAENKLPPLSYSATVAGAAHGHAQDKTWMAGTSPAMTD